MSRIALAGILLGLASPLFAEELNVVGWNVESGGNDPDVIAQELADFDGVDVWGLSEVKRQNALKYVVAAAQGEDAFFEWRRGNTGGGDRLLIIWDSHKYEKLGELELFDLRMENGRAPLAVKLESKATGAQFWFMVNHLYRGDADKRRQQAIGLREWFSQQTIPVIATGDYNFDFDIPDGPGNEAFQEMVKEGHAIWLRPSTLIKTNSNPSFNSVLDFVFVNDDAAPWFRTSSIVVRPGDFPDGPERSDHRPVAATFEIDVAPPPESFAVALAEGESDGGDSDVEFSRRFIRMRLDALEREIAELRRLLEEIE